MKEYYINVRSLKDVVQHYTLAEALDDLNDDAFDYIHTVHVNNNVPKILNLTSKLRAHAQDQKEWGAHEVEEIWQNFHL